MKNFIKFLMPVAVAALALVSCNKEEDLTAHDPNAVKIRVHAIADELNAGDPESKTYINSSNTIIWGTGEYMKLALTTGENTTFANSTDASADTFNGDAEAMFEFSVTPEAASEYVYQGLYPASAAAPSNNTNAANYKVNLPSVQNATASSYDPAAYIMVVKPETFATVQTDWEASFRRGTALNKITLKNFASSVSINKVKITAEGKKLAGGRHFNLTTGEGLEVYGTDATIEVLYATPLTGTSMDVWFTSWDAEIAEGEKLTVIAYTTDNKSYTREITVPAGKSIKFQEGYLNNTGVSMSGISPEDVTTIEGNYVILAEHSGDYYALKGEASGTRIASIDYTGSTTSYAGDASIIWTIAPSGSSYTIKNNGNYVGWNGGTGSAANNAGLIAEADYDADKCLMTIDKDGDVYHIKVSADPNRALARNTGSAYFAFYASTGQYSDIVLVPATALETVATPTFSPAAGEVTSGTEVAISCSTSGATIHYTVDGTDPTSSSATYSSPIAITATTTIKAIAVKDGMADSEVATAQYTIAGVIDYSVIETSNVTLTAGTNGSSATVNEKEAIKVGTSSKGGDLTVTVPAGTTKLHLHAAAWNGVTGLSLNISGANVSPASIALTADSGISGNSPFTLAGNPEDFYFVLELSNITADTDITFTSSIAKRFVVWGVNAEAGASVTWNLASISITTAPTKTTYTAGETFDPTGMVVTATYVDASNAGRTKEVVLDNNDLTFSPSTSAALTTSDTEITITYENVSTTQAITVSNGKVDILTKSWSTINGSSYVLVTGLSGSASDAVYSVQAAGGDSTSGDAIQLRSNNSNSGIVSTASGGILKSITVKWNSTTADARVLDIYGRNTAYTNPTDLYGNDKGTLLCSFTKEDGDASYTFASDYEYIGIRSNSGAIYLTEIDIEWTPVSWTLSSIAVTTAPTKTSYEAGEDFDPTGMVVTATYVDEDDQSHTKTAVIDNSELTINPSSNLTAGTTSVSISYGGKSTTQAITVTVPITWDLKSIAVTTPPTKTTYNVGEFFNPAGMVVTATYENHNNIAQTKTETIANENLTFSPSTSTALAADNTSVTISYNGKSTSQAITVNSGTQDHSATINFGSATGSTNVNAASVTGNDSQGNTWTVTTAGTTSFTPNASYAQIGSSSKPASSITFTTTLSSSATVKAFSAKFGGFNSTAGTVTLKVGDTTVGSGSLNASNDVTVSASNTTTVGTVLTVTVTGISKGVKAYQINVTYNN